MAKTLKMRNRAPQSIDSEDCYEEEEEENAEQFEEEEEEEKQESVEQKAESKSVVVKVKRIESGVNDELSMEIDRDIELKWLMLHYSEKVGYGNMNQLNTKYMFNGALVRETDTPLRLSMLPNDIIYVFSRVSNCDHLRYRAGDFYRTLSIRLHKARDILVRVSCSDPLVQQLKRHFLRENDGKCVWTCFFYNGRQLREDDCVARLHMDDGDIIDAFDFGESSSSVKIITPINRDFTLKMRYQNGVVSSFKTKGSTLLTKVAHRCAVSIGIKPEKVELLYYGRRLRLPKTVEEENLFDGCQIDVFIRDL